MIRRQAYRLAPDPYNPNLTSILDADGQVVDSFRSATCGAYYLALLEEGASVNPHSVLGTRIGGRDASRPLLTQEPTANSPAADETKLMWGTRLRSLATKQ